MKYSVELDYTKLRIDLVVGIDGKTGKVLSTSSS